MLKKRVDLQGKKVEKKRENHAEKLKEGGGSLERKYELGMTRSRSIIIHQKKFLFQESFNFLDTRIETTYSITYRSFPIYSSLLAT